MATNENAKGLDLHVSPLVRLVFLVLGFIFVILAIAGVFLPLLPTTPFLLLAAGSFARSSEKFYHLLLSNPHFGPCIRDWHQYRCMRKGIKVLAIFMVVAACAWSMYSFREVEAVMIGILILMLAVGLLLLRIPTCSVKSAK